MCQAPLFLIPVEMLQNCLFELCGGPESVFACNDVQGLLNTSLHAGYDSLCDCRSDEFQDSQADGSSYQGSFLDFFRDGIRGGVNRADTADEYVLALHILDMYGIMSVCVDSVYDFLVHIGKDDIVS